MPVRVAVVVPVRGHSDLLGGCLDSLEAQTRRPDVVLVVDDAPEPVLAPSPRFSVLGSGGAGPYTARNLGWRSLDVDVVVFCDARSRPRPRWLEALSAACSQDGVGLAGCDVRVLPGRSLAARAAAVEQPFAVDAYVERAWFRPYLPTCSLAVRRDALVAVDGFSPGRSGGDADLCWRVQDAGWRLAVVPEVLLDWVPRERLRDLLEQHYRYGRSNAHLRAAWSDRGAQVLPVPSWARVARMGVTALARTGYGALRRREDRVLHSLVELARVATRVGARVGAADIGASGDPR